MVAASGDTRSGSAGGTPITSNQTPEQEKRKERRRLEATKERGNEIAGREKVTEGTLPEQRISRGGRRKREPCSPRLGL